MSTLTLEIVSKALFGTDLGDEKDEFTDAVTAAMTYANHLTNHFINPPLFVPTPGQSRRAARHRARRPDRLAGDRTTAPRRRYARTTSSAC